MQLFYTENISGSSAHFDGEESAHGIRVLRLHKGDSLTFTDGKGNLYEGVITADDHREMTAEIISVSAGYEKKPYRLHLAVSPLKNADRYEWLIEKAVEIGVDMITPIICDRTERQSTRHDRLQKIIISAMKQSLKCYCPILNPPAGFSQLLKEEHEGERVIAHCIPDIERKALTEVVRPGKDYTIAIGPEGDFTREEVEAALIEGFTPVHMGRHRLRTETAGVVACCSVYLSNI